MNLTFILWVVGKVIAIKIRATSKITILFNSLKNIMTAAGVIFIRNCEH